MPQIDLVQGLQHRRLLGLDRLGRVGVPDQRLDRRADPVLLGQSRVVADDGGQGREHLVLHRRAGCVDLGHETDSRYGTGGGIGVVDAAYVVGAAVDPHGNQGQ